MQVKLKNFRLISLTILQVGLVGSFLAPKICLAEELAKQLINSLDEEPHVGISRNPNIEENLNAAIENLTNAQNSDVVSSLLEAKPNQQLTEIRSSGLYIFVSSSMPKALLKSYLQEATKYRGVLVFNGLPNGSFKELFQLVKELTEDDVSYNSEVMGVEHAGVQIDDEAFERFKITSVPTIVLSCYPQTIEELSPKEGDPSRSISYDLIKGNVGIKYALEQFSSSGDFKNEALEHLHERP